jgi:uncharacterized membrane protein (UPF0127 family)
MMILGMGAGTLAQVAPPWRNQAAPLETTQIVVGGVPLTVELAYRPEDTARGLSYRDGLAPGTGMLFLFIEPGMRTFHMRGMRFCLDLVWINESTIVGATENVCPTAADTPDEAQPLYPSPQIVTSVLEVPAGWLDAYGLGIGTQIENMPRLILTKSEPESSPETGQ